MDEIQKTLVTICRELFDEELKIEVTRPDEQFGDLSTNVALQLAAKLQKNPREVAETIAARLRTEPLIGEVSIAGPGFINIRLTDQALLQAIAVITSAPEAYGMNDSYKAKTFVIEHTDPNPFKEFHIGHAYSNTIGEALGRLLQAGGAIVHQVSYHGDVGRHVAMALYGLKQLKPGTLTSEVLGKAYALGATKLQDDPAVAAEIKAINKAVYEKSDPALMALYEQGRALSFEYFKSIYELLKTSFEKQYFESETAAVGLAVVKKHEGTVFEKSDGAIVFKGDEQAGLHTRVFVTGEGLPTYETKELGLALAKQHDYPEAESFVVVTANEIDEYFRVLVAALQKIDEELARKIRHISHGVVRLPEGKMSSRTGQVVTTTDVLARLEQAIRETQPDAPAIVESTLAALKYTFLKHRLGGDIVFDIKESISLEGNSGPYIQYAFARACSILDKATSSPTNIVDLEAGERSLLRKITEYPEVVRAATAELMPHLICTYLYELAQVFNRFYEHNRVIGEPREGVRVQLVRAYAQVLYNGLTLLNIPAPERM